MARPGRSTIFFELLDACTRAGCPVCRLTLRSVARFFDSLAYENTNDPGIRAELRASRGFCNRHAWQYAEQRDSLGTAIIYRDILRDVLRDASGASDEPIDRLARAAGQLLSNDPDGRDRDRLLRAMVPRRPCMACAQEDTTGRDAVDALLQRLDEPDVVPALEGSAGLCRHHLHAALRLARRTEQRRRLVEAQRSAWTRLRDQVAAGDAKAGAAALAGNAGAAS